MPSKNDPLMIFVAAIFGVLAITVGGGVGLLVSQYSPVINVDWMIRLAQPWSPGRLENALPHVIAGVMAGGFAAAGLIGAAIAYQSQHKKTVKVVKNRQTKVVDEDEDDIVLRRIRTARRAKDRNSMLLSFACVIFAAMLMACVITAIVVTRESRAPDISPEGPAKSPARRPAASAANKPSVFTGRLEMITQDIKSVTSAFDKNPSPEKTILILRLDSGNKVYCYFKDNAVLGHDFSILKLHGQQISVKGIYETEAAGIIIINNCEMISPRIK